MPLPINIYDLIAGKTVELDLTEGKATGIPIVRKALKENGSPDPVFETEDDRSYFS